MPFYNGAKTVIRALDSIYEIALPMDEFEVIIVDDCSPIMAADVLDEYRKIHPNISIIRHPKNTRQGGAKNTGMSLAKGRYIALIDQDDMINPVNMSQAIGLAIENDVDIISCHYSILHENGITEEVGVDYPSSKILSGVEFCELYYDTHDSIGPWSYLYKTEYLQALKRPMMENVLLEDPDWTIWHLIHAEKMCFLDKPIYVWVMNSQSITHSTHKEKNRVDWIKAGSRKLLDAQAYSSLSQKFSNKIIEDARWNIEGGFHKLWKVNNYCAFYKYLDETLTILQQMTWSGATRFYIMYPKWSMTILYLLGTPVRLLFYAKNKIK